MYKIKQQPEDFIVKEISLVKKEEKGQYLYALLRKRQYTTLRAIDHIAEALGIPLKNIGFAGTKDKEAITDQLISIKGIAKKRLENLNLKDIALTYEGKGEKPISLGDLEGNAFTIIVRNIDEKEINNAKDKSTNLMIPNYYGEQRFGHQNSEIGRLIIKKKFKDAVSLLIKNDAELSHELQDYLSNNPNNYVGALNKINKKILRFYVHAYQSYLFNKLIFLFFRDNQDKQEQRIMPIIGFGTETSDPEMNGLIKKIMEQEQITKRDFIIREFADLSAEGDKRNLFMEIDQFNLARSEDDEMNKGKKKVTITFTLKKGQYATVVIDYLFNNLSNVLKNLV